MCVFLYTHASFASACMFVCMLWVLKIKVHAHWLYDNHVAICDFSCLFVEVQFKYHYLDAYPTEYLILYLKTIPSETVSERR